MTKELKNNIIRMLVEYYETLEDDRHNDFTYVWKRGYIKGILKAIELVEEFEAED